jgi:hemolysin activation/secretion protein
MKRNQLVLTGCLLVLTALAPIEAQSLSASYDQFAPKPVPPSGLGPIKSPAPATEMGGPSGQVLLRKLKGLVFVGRPEDVVLPGVEKSQPIVFDKDLQVPAPEEFRALVSPFIGQKLTRGKLNDLITAIIVHYRKNDHPVVDVIVPQQDINAGIVQILLLESRVNEVKVAGNNWFPSDEISDCFRTEPGGHIIASDMRSDLAWANQNPFHTSDIIYQPGPETGTTDVILQTQDRFPARFYAGYEDSGNPQTGYDRYIAGLNWGDAWGAGLGHQLNYQYTSSGDMRSLQAHAGSYVIPLPWHHTLTFFGNYITTQGQLPPFIAIQGLSYQASMRYDIPLPPVGEYKHSIGGGFDYKYNRSSLQFGEVAISTLPTAVEQFAFTYNGSLRDRFGITSVGAQIYYSPGDWGGYNNDTAFNASHTFATSSYDYANVQLSRLTRLPGDWSLFLHGTLQFSNSNLVPSEQLGLGGYDTIRGYDEREVNNDEGYIFNLELRTPTLRIGKTFGWNQFNDQLQLLAFWDTGAGYNHNPLPGEASETSLSSVGGGLRYSINTNLSVRADYGFQLQNTGLDTLHGGRGDIGVVISY